MAIELGSRTRELIAMLDEAVDLDCVHGRCDKVKAILQDVFQSGDCYLPKEMLQPHSECYARRLLHRDPDGRYSIVVMVWGVGQGTPLHDHAGEWCVECVYRGKITVDSYERTDDGTTELAQFRKQETVQAGVGEAGALIPPFEYHTIANALQEPTVTVHVYGHELKSCHIFVPVEGGYRRETRELRYTD